LRSKASWLALALIAASTLSHAETVIVTLGTAAGPIPRVDRTQSSNLLVVNGTPYLVDAGDNVTRRIVQAGYDYRKVEKVFITHAHSDHTMGLPTLLATLWDNVRREPTDIYGSGAQALVEGLVAYLTPNSEIRWNEGRRLVMREVFRGHEIAPGVVYQDANVKVIAAENTHFGFPKESPAYGKYRSYSYRFETPGRTVVFTGDTGPTDAVVELSRGADVLVTEVTSVEDVVEIFKKNGSWQKRAKDEQDAFVRHMHEEHVTPEEVGQLAAKAGVKSVVMTHLSASVNPKEDYKRYAEAAGKFYSGPVSIARDLQKF